MPKDTPNQQIKKLTAEKRELAKRCNDLEQKINAIYSRNSDPDIVTLYHQLEGRLEAILEKLKDEKAKTQSLQQQLSTTEENLNHRNTEYTELEYRLNQFIQELKIERALNKELEKELSKYRKPKSSSTTASEPKEKKEVGRPSKVTEEIIEKVLQLRKDGVSVRAVASKLGLSVGTVSKIIKDNK